MIAVLIGQNVLGPLALNGTEDNPLTCSREVRNESLCVGITLLNLTALTLVIDNFRREQTPDSRRMLVVFDVPALHEKVTLIQDIEITTTAIRSYCQLSEGRYYFAKISYYHRFQYHFLSVRLGCTLVAITTLSFLMYQYGISFLMEKDCASLATFKQALTNNATQDVERD